MQYKNLVLLIILIVSPIAKANLVTDSFRLSYNKNIFAQQNILDLKSIPQDTRTINHPGTGDQKSSFEEYFTSYFAPWSEHNFTADNLKEIASERKTYFAENYNLISKRDLDEIENNANIAAINSIKQKAIVTKYTNLRVLPTKTMLFSNPTQAGEGYPFDYAQGDYLTIGDPVLISHYSLDGIYAYVLTSSGTSSFVLAEDLAVVDQDFIDNYKKNLGLLVDNTLADLGHGKIQLYSSLVLPINGNKAYLPYRNITGKAELFEVTIDPNSYVTTPLAFTKENVRRVINQHLGRPYGWGGNLCHNDCARLVRNYFALFGISMLHLSKEQATQGTITGLSSLDSLTKKSKIIAEAVPYQTTICMPGHIGVYLGDNNGEPIFLHALWGIKLFDEVGEEYRFVIGKTVITTLSPGKELPGFDVKKTNLLNKVSSMANLFVS